LWLGSPTGLVRFDGLQFEPFRAPEGQARPPLQEAWSTLFAPPGDSGLWIGYRFGGVGWWHGGPPANISDLRMGSHPAPYSRFAASHDGTIWAGTTTGLANFLRAALDPGVGQRVTRLAQPTLCTWIDLTRCGW